MAAGLVQLVAYGIQDIYLTGDPQITFFKILYRRHTNFSVESLVQNFSSTANFGETVSCTISRSGDLVGKIFLYVEIPSLPKFINSVTGEEDMSKKIAWVNYLGYALVKELFIEIGGKQIDKQYGEWLYIWSQVSCKMDHALNKMVGNVPTMYEFTNGKPGYKLYIPLEFWFCRNTGLSLPLVALASADVKITITFRKLEECYRIGPTHSIEILEDIVPFQLGDYIEQTVNKQTIYGYVIDYDFLQKKLYYIKIQSPTANKKYFESYSISKVHSKADELNLPLCGQGRINDSRKTLFEDLHESEKYGPICQTKNMDNPNFYENIPYRIYNSITKTYCTPKPQSREIIESNLLSHKPRFVNSFLYVDYIYLDNDERNKFARTNHEYLIEQIQYNEDPRIASTSIKHNLGLNHPCKAHYWIIQLDSLVGPGTINDLFNYTTSHIHYPRNHQATVPNYHLDYCPEADNKLDKQEKYYGSNILTEAKLVLNGRNRFGERGPEYSNLVEPYEHHYRGPSVGINVYSPAFYPEKHQPSSAINMSKIDSISMEMRLKNIISPQNTAKVRSYTINYNVLKICFNLAGLTFGQNLTI